MARHRLFCERLGKGVVTLAPEESHHALVALRGQQGQEVVLFDGAGAEALGVISRIEHHRVSVEVSTVTHRPFELAHRITLAVAMTKTHRQGYLIEKCTELGVAAIWPIIADRSVVKPRAGALGRWSRRAIEAAKQSGRAWVPAIAAPQAFAECLARIGEFDAASLTLPSPGLVTFSRFLAARRKNERVLVCVGPEGGWSDPERDQAIAAGAVPTSLAPTLLRTETAAVAVCAAAAMCAVTQEV